MTLKEAMPKEFMGCEFENYRVRKYADMQVVSEHKYNKWIGKRKNVLYWVELVNGYAVGMNESPSHGLGFEVVKLIK
jgi:hypothetical protein